jgi:glutathione S-transferase
MLLIGQYDSPFVRRVGIALTWQGLAFRHEPWSVFRDAERIRAFNPLLRVPTLELDDGTALTDSHMILDHLDAIAPPGQALFPREEPARHRALRIAALACGAGEKAGSLFYEQCLHETVSELWVRRCRAQIKETLALLEGERAALQGEHWFGDRPGHADIAVAVVLRFILEAHPGLVTPQDVPLLAADAERLEALPVFQAIRQPFIPPA